MTLFRRLKTVTEEACNRLWAGPGERIHLGCHAEAGTWNISPEPDDCFRTDNPPTGITLEERDTSGWERRLWLTRGSEEFRVPLRSDERLQCLVVASGAPVVCALIFKRCSGPNGGVVFDAWQLVP
jgi:hypothetical protein